MIDPKQSSLFGDDQSLVAQQAPASLSAAQRKFQKLSADIEAGKAQLRALQDMLASLKSRAAGELMPLHERYTAARRQLAIGIDRALQQGVKLGRVQRESVERWLVDLCDSQLQEDSSDLDLEAIFDRYSDMAWAELRASRHDVLTMMTEDFAREMFGDDPVDGHDADNPEDLMRFVQQRLEERNAQKASKRKPSRKQQEKQAKRELEEKEATQSVRDIFRKLASAVHPDREPDLTLRAERTELMQRINSAYQSNDLLALLTLQREAEGFAAIDAMNESEERLKVFVRVLDEQHKALRSEIDDLLLLLRELAGENGWLLRTPADFERDFERNLGATESQLKMIERDIGLVLDASTARQYLVALATQVRDRRKARF